MTATTTIRVRRSSRERLRELAGDGQLMDTFDEALEALERERFWERSRRSWERVMADPQARGDEAADLALLDGALRDGLE
jgi:hypothetical protein